jgi:hypothetical protein
LRSFLTPVFFSDWSSMKLNLQAVPMS